MSDANSPVRIDAREEVFASWLRKRLARQTALRLLSAAFMLLLGAAIVFVTYWFCYAFFWFITWAWIDLEPWVFSTAAAAAVVLLFIGNARTDPGYLSEISFTTGTYSNEVVTFYMPGVGMVSNINPLAPESVHSMAKVITSMLYTGPRAVVAGLRLLRSFIELLRVDAAPCARVIAHLHVKGARASFPELMRQVDGINPVRTFPQLGLIDGVLFLTSEPPGLSLNSELREELDRVMAS